MVLKIYIRCLKRLIILPNIIYEKNSVYLEMLKLCLNDVILKCRKPSTED